MLARYGNHPQRIEMDLVSVYGSLARQIVSDELPANEEVLALQVACEEGARGMRATHPKVADNRLILSEQAWRELPEAAAAQLREAAPILKAISEEGLAEEWQLDIRELINDAVGPVPNHAPPLPAADAATRIFSRAAKISIWLKLAEVVHGVDGSAGYKAARIVATVAALVTLGSALLL